MQVKKTNYLINNTPTFEVLTEEEIEAIYYAALTVLSETGVRVYNKEGYELAFITDGLMIWGFGFLYMILFP